MNYIIYIFLTILITMFMIYIGFMKEKSLPYELTAKLYKKGTKEIQDYLLKNQGATINDLKKCIKNVQASVIWSRKKVAVTNPNQFVDFIIDNMTKQGKLEVKQENGKKLYYLK